MIDTMTTTPAAGTLPHIPRAVALGMLAAIYDRLPGVACKGLCDDSCTQIDASELERQELAARGMQITEDHPHVILDRYRVGEVPPCPALTADRRCSVYEVRPFICRAFGMISAAGVTGPARFAQPMMCDHGCEPAGAPLTMREFAAAMCDIEALSRAVTGMARAPLPGDSAILTGTFKRVRAGGIPVAAGDIHAHRTEPAIRAAARRERQKRKKGRRR